MTAEFEHVRAAFATSVPGRMLTWCGDVTRASWRSSAVGNATRSAGAKLRTMPAAALITTMAVAVAVAAISQPLLMAAMPQTVRPAAPWAAFIGVAIIAGGVFWQAETIAGTWPASRVARWINR